MMLVGGMSVQASQVKGGKKTKREVSTEVEMTKIEHIFHFSYAWEALGWCASVVDTTFASILDFSLSPIWE